MSGLKGAIDAQDFPPRCKPPPRRPEDDYTFGAAVLRLSLGQKRERVDWQVEGEFPVLVNLPERAVAPAPQGQLGLGANYYAASGRQDASAILKQAYVRVKHLFGDRASSLRAGRFEFVDGGAFQEGSFGYVGRASAGRRGLGTLFDLSADVNVTPTTTLAFYGAGVRGGDMQATIYPAGGRQPTARFLYAELTRRF